MKKLYISADIEGTCGIAHWDETSKDKRDYSTFARQMTREVAAACEGALEAGMDFILVRDAHGPARNIDPSLLPSQVQVIRGWGPDPLCMVHGIDESFHAAIFTGYHDAAGTGQNPLAHTMDTSLIWITVNGDPASEAMLNAYAAAYFRVPLAVITGDQGICSRMQALIPALTTVPVNKGQGGAVQSIHPDEAVKRIREGVAKALKNGVDACLLSMPEAFRVEIRFRDVQRAYRAGFYPGMQTLDSHTLRFETADYYELLRMVHFCV